MTPDEKTYAALWLRELGGYCRELPPEERSRKRAEDRRMQRILEERELSTVPAPESPHISPNCAEICGQGVPERPRECA